MARETAIATTPMNTFRAMDIRDTLPNESSFILTAPAKGDTVLLLLHPLLKGRGGHWRLHRDFVRGGGDLPASLHDDLLRDPLAGGDERVERIVRVREIRVGHRGDAGGDRLA